MKKTTNTTEEKTTKTSLLQPFTFIESESYLLKLKNGSYVVAYWEGGHFLESYGDDYVENEIEGYVSIKDLGLWKLY